MSRSIQLHWEEPGPVCAAFVRSMAPVRGICGPVGSGKTSACLRTCAQHAWTTAIPHPSDGVRRWKMTVLRDTYRQLEKTTIPSWHRWFPRTVGKWTGGEGGRPATHEMLFELPDGSRCELIAEFIGVGENAVEDIARGLETSCLYINEADLMTRNVIPHFWPRLGRYPAKDPAIGFPGNPWRGIVLDCNAPDTDNWIYETFVEHRPEGWEWYMQPGGLDPDAENIANLPGGRDYYAQAVKGQPDWWANRFVHNRFGYSRDGKPVYPEWNDARHVAPEPLLANPELPLHIGADAGWNAAAVLAQQDFGGQWRILDELVLSNIGAKTFGEELARLLASEKYREVKKLSPWADPAAFARSSTDEKSWVEVVSAASGLRFKPAPTNDILPRVEAVRVPLTRFDGLKYGLVLSPTCKALRRGFNSGYRFKRHQIGNGERYEDKPEKNDYSHPHDALQYALSGGGEYYVVTGRKAQRERSAQAMREMAAQAAAYDPTSW